MLISFLIVAIPCLFAATRSVIPEKAKQPEQWRALERLPLSFEPNMGQADPRVRFLARAPGHMLLLADSEVFLALRERVIGMKLAGARQGVSYEGVMPLAGASNYFIGSDPSKWVRSVPNYGRVEARGVYPGIDLVFYGKERRMEYDFVLAPGADPKQIRLAWEGVDGMKLSGGGDLVLQAGAETVTLHRPKVYQELAGGRVELPSDYRIVGRREAQFVVARHDVTRPLIIDPVLSYSTYLGGTGAETMGGIAVDTSGNAYVTGQTSSTNFPVVAGSYRTTRTGTQADAFVAKINTGGGQLLYSTYLGGGLEDRAVGIAVDAMGSAVVAGNTTSSDFPVTSGAYRPSAAGSFVTKLNASGSNLLFSTYFGTAGTFFPLPTTLNGLALDTQSNVYLVGSTTATDFPVTAGAAQGTKRGAADAYVTKMASDGRSLMYSTLLGGDQADVATAVTVDALGGAHVVGTTSNSGFPGSGTPYPTTPNAFQKSLKGSSDAFITKVNAGGSAFEYSTLLGGSGADSGTGIALGPNGQVYITGLVQGNGFSNDFPTTLTSFRPFAGQFFNPGFLAAISADGSSLLYGTYLIEGTPSLLLVQPSGAITLAFNSGFNSLPTTTGAIQSLNGGIYLLQLDPTGSFLTYGSYLGGVLSLGPTYSSIRGGAFDAMGFLYVAGETGNALFTTTPGAVQERLAVDGLATDGFVMKLDMSGPLCEATLVPSQINFDYRGGSATVILTTASGCPWSLDGMASFVTVTPRINGVGSATLMLTAGANTGNSFLSTTGAVLGKQLVVQQAATQCSYQATPPNGQFPASGGIANFTVLAAGSCMWAAGSNTSWLRFYSTFPSSFGSISIQVIIDPNTTGMARMGSLTLAGITIPVLQPAAGSVPVYSDVPGSHPYFDFINLLFRSGIATECAAGQYCPEAPMTRAQMAIFLVRGVIGGDSFAFPQTPYFTDIPANHPQFKWIQKLRELNITTGCTATTYCPDDTVTRGQMAVFLVRARLRIGAGQPFAYSLTSFFDDVPGSHPYFSYIQRLREWGVTSGCTPITYCPDAPTTRGQMAVFAARSFLTPF